MVRIRDARRHRSLARVDVGDRLVRRGTVRTRNAAPSQRCALMTWADDIAETLTLVAGVAATVAAVGLVFSL